MKKFWLYLFLITVLILPAGVAFAAWGMDIVVTENGTASHEMIGCNITANIDYMEAEGYIGDNGTDTQVEKAGSAKPHMLVDDRIMFAIPVSGNSTNNLDFTTGNTPVLSSFYTIPGYDGYVTVADNTSIELGDNFTITQSGWWDTDVGNAKNAVYKKGAFITYISGTENITSRLGFEDGFDTDDWTDTSTKILVNTGNSRLEYEAERVVEDQRCYIDLLSIDDSLWSLDFTWEPTSQVGVSAIMAFGLWDALANLNAYPSDAIYMKLDNVSAALVYEDGGGGDTSAAITITHGNTYYVTLERLATDNCSLSIFSDAVRETHIAGSPKTLAPTSTLVGLRYLGASNYNTDSAPDEQIGWIDDVGGLFGLKKVTSTGVESDEHTVETIADTTFFYMEHGDVTWENFAPAMADVEVNAPLWHAESNASPFSSKDVNEHAFTVTDATWSANGYVFDGTNDVISTPNPSLGIASGFTVIAGFKIDAVAGDQTLVDIRAANDSGEFALSTNGDDIYFYLLRNVAGTYHGYGVVDVLSADTYYTVAVTWVGGNINVAPLIYLDGVPQTVVDLGGAGTQTGVTDTANPLRLGLKDGDSSDLAGTINTVVIYSRVLDPQKILDNYDATKWQYEDTTDYFYYQMIGVGVPDTDADLTFYQNNVLPYSDNTTFEIDGDLELWFSPNDIISGTILPDRGDAPANDGTFTFGSNPSGIGIALGAMASDYTATEAPPLATPDVVPVLTPPVTTADAAKLAGLADHPLTPAIHAVSGVTGIYELLWWWYGTLVLALLLFGVTYKWIKNLMLSGAAFCAVVAYGVHIGIFDFYVIFAIGVILAGCVVLQARRGMS